MLCERNKFHCDHCGGLQEAERRMKIKRLPRILALHLKRFKYSEDLQRMHKLFHRVVYPYHLRLFNTTDDAEDPDRLYELYAIVVHIGGGPYHGHYVSVVKTPECGWLLFDDELVEPVDKSYVRNFFGDRPGLAAAYVLFYQETTYEAVRREQEAEAAAAAAAALKTSKAGSTTTTTAAMGPKRSVDGLTASSTKPAAGLAPSLLTPALPNEKQQPATSANNGDALSSKSPVSANGRESGVHETSPVAETANGKMPPPPPRPPPSQPQSQPSSAQPAERTRSSARASFGHLRRKVFNSFSSSKDNAKNGHTDS
jgi:ubiquitin carboxyl-terminal hydrolase 9/13